MDNLRGQLEQFQQRVASKSPSLCISRSKGLRVCEDFGEGKNGGFAIQRASKFLGILKDDIEVDRGEETGVSQLASHSQCSCDDLLLLNLLRHLHDEVGAVPLVVVGGNEMEEADEAKREVLGLGVLQTLQNDLHDRNKVLLQSSPAQQSSISWLTFK